MGGSESTLSAAKSAAGSQLNPQPVFINDEKKHKVTVFMSPDHSIQPLADFIMSATKSVDLYIPELKSWLYGSNKPLVSAMWLTEQNPIFQALANVGVKKVPVRVITNGPQLPLIPASCDMWEWLLLQNAKIGFTPPGLNHVGGIMIMIDGGDKILLTTIDGSPASFMYNRESSIIIETKCDDVTKLFTDTFNNDFKKCIPFTPPKKVILNSRPPLIDPASLALIQVTTFKITSVPQPPEPLIDSPLDPYISEIMEADDAEFTLAMAGPELVELNLQYAVNVLTFVQIAARSMSNPNISEFVIQSFEQNQSTSVNLSYTLTSKQEAEASDANLLKMHNAGMDYRLFRGPLYNEKPATKQYFTHSGQAYINTGEGILYFMTGDFSDRALNKSRNFYIGFKSPILSKQITTIFSKDQLFAPRWNPTDKTAVGEESSYKPSLTSLIPKPGLPKLPSIPKPEIPKPAIPKP